MLRFLRTRPSLFAPRSRPILRPNKSPPEPDTIQLQRVRIRRKWFKPWLILGATATYFVCYTVYTTSIVRILSKFVEEQVAQMSPKERKKLAADVQKAEPLSLPLPFTENLVEPAPYKGTDPEWRAFAKLSRDKKTIESLKFTVADTVRKAVEAHPNITAHYGKEWKINRSWFDLLYPQKPPPTYERKVISVGDGGLQISTKPVDAVNVFRLQRILMPTTLTLSMWTFGTALARQNFQDMATYLGYHPKQPQASHLNVQQALEKLRQHMEKPPPKIPGSTEDPTSDSLSRKHADAKTERTLASPAKKQTADGATTGSGSASTTSSPAPAASQTSSSKGLPDLLLNPFTKGGSEEQDKKFISAKEIYGVPQMSEHTSGPRSALKARFAKLWKPIRPLPPKGSVWVGGLVEVANPKASIVVEVAAWFDPKTSMIDRNTFSMAFRAIKPRKISPVSR